MTLLDSEDLARRTCPECGAYVGDWLRHRVWHQRGEQFEARTFRVLAGLVDITTEGEQQL